MDQTKQKYIYHYYDLSLAGIRLTYGFRFPETIEYLKAFSLGPSDKHDGIYLPEYEWGLWEADGSTADAYCEYSCLTAVTSDVLTAYQRCVIHAVAFRFQNKAYLIAAPSGVGKSTQIRTLQTLFPEQFSIICGDRPILEFCQDGTIMVHPSPWNGKENWHGAAAAPLAGIILLKRGDENEMRQLKSREAVVPVYGAMIQTMETESLLHRFADFSTKLIQYAPVWQLINRGVPDSTRLLYDTLFSVEASK